MIRRLLMVLGLTVRIIPGFTQSTSDVDPTHLALLEQQNDLRHTLNLSDIEQLKKDLGRPSQKENWQIDLVKMCSMATAGSCNEEFTDNRDYPGLVWYKKDPTYPFPGKGSVSSFVSTQLPMPLNVRSMASLLAGLMKISSS